VTKKLSENFITAQVAVTTSAAKAWTGQAGIDSITLYNAGSATAYIGNSAAVTSSTGFPLIAGAALTMESTADIYAIGAASTTLAIIQEG
jgi:hypothetical protein